MPNPRPRRPWRPRLTPEQRLIAMLEEIERQRRHALWLEEKAWNDAICKRAWATAWTDGTRCCGKAQFDAAENELIAEGMVPPAGR